DLGRLLFFDPRLTVDADLSCSSCHQAARYGTDGLPKSIGVRQRPHPRHAPTILNAGLNFIIHWRGDRDSLEDQVIKALASPITNGQPDEKAIIDRLEQIPSYAPLFKAAFPDDPRPSGSPETRVSASPSVTPSCTRAMTRTASGSVATGDSQ